LLWNIQQALVVVLCYPSRPLRPGRESSLLV
jgi:hypothetical protein